MNKDTAMLQKENGAIFTKGARKILVILVV